MNPDTSRLFDRCGPASLDDLSTETWRSIFSELAEDQKKFLSVAPHSPDYRWPKDPLRNWSRCWEYPYVFDNICSLVPKGSKLLDYGSGATFFPFALARRGYSVVCVDSDPVCVADVGTAQSRLAQGSYDVKATLSDGRSIPLGNETFDVVYSISVLEHLPDPSAVIKDLHRVLRPGGLFVLTFDVEQIEGNENGIGPQRYDKLKAALLQFFEPFHPYQWVHPALQLTCPRGPYAMRIKGWAAVWRTLKDEVLKPLLDRPVIVGPNVSIEAYLFRKR